MIKLVLYDHILFTW